MSQKIRIASFNLENLDIQKKDSEPTLETRILLIRPQIERLNADILCLQEINGQEFPGNPRELYALRELIKDTLYENYYLASTKTSNGRDVYDERNLVVLSRFEITDVQQYKNTFIRSPKYQLVTAQPYEDEAKQVEWERPLLYCKINLPDNEVLHLLNLHLKSKLPSNIPGQRKDSYTWKTASGWAEGYFLSSMKRVGQALETRVLVDKIIMENGAPFIVVCGDFNAESDEVPVMAIRGDIENTGNFELIDRVLVPCENTIPEYSRYSLLHQGKGEMIDHLLISRNMLKYYRRAEVYNEMLHDESIAFATDKKYPESDHAPIVAEFEM